MTRRTGALATTCLLCVSMAGGAQGVPGRTPERAKIVAAAVDVMKKARFCGLVTLGRNGHPQARVVDPFEPERDLTVWIATKAATRKVEEIRADSRVTLLYFDSSGPGYVTLLAKAEVVTDPHEKASHWKDEWTTFYADKNRGDDYTLIRCKPIRLELVSYDHGLLGDPSTWRPIGIEFALTGGVAERGPEAGKP